MFSSNSESSGRFHTDWLNMMYPRLKLARNLLREDGVIFISIDDNEAYHVRELLDDIFGEENFFAQIPWQSRTSVQNDTDFSDQHEYIIAYAKTRRTENRRLKENNISQWFELKSFAAFPKPLDESRFDNPDNDSRGKWKADPFDAPNVRENLIYPITNDKTGETHWPPKGRHWRVEKEKYEQLLADKRIVFGVTGDARPQLKVFYEEKKIFGEVPTSWFDGINYGTSTNGTQELQALFGGISPFTFPKPTNLLKTLIRLTTRNDDVILDFFAGSGTTGHAVMAQNAVDGGNRHFVLVQLPEPLDADNRDQKTAANFCDQLGKPRTIAELTKERLRRAAQKTKAENPLFAGDTGFRAYKLDSTNLLPWDPDLQDIAGSLFASEEHLKAGRTEHDILTELLLKLGLPLTVPLEERTVEGHTLYAVGAGVLLAYLAPRIEQEAVEPLAQALVAWRQELAPIGDSQVVLRDSAFRTDVAKTNFTAILEQAGFDRRHIRSL